MLKLFERIMSKVSPEPNSGCWLWMGAVSGGYGHIRGAGSQLVHRVLYELQRGPVPQELELDHLCRVRCCVNPWHLEPVTRSENLKRSPLVGKAGLQKRIPHDNSNSRKKHCPAGHEYSQANTFLGSHNQRRCRECNRIAKRRQRLQLKGQ